MRRIWDKLSGEDPNLDDSFNVIEQQFFSQSVKDPKSTVITANRDSPGAGNTNDSGSKNQNKKSGKKSESGVLIAYGVSPGARNSNEVTAEVTETHVRFQTCSIGQERIIIGPDSGNTKMYIYLTEQATKLLAAFPQSVKGCIHTADVLVDRNSVSKDNVSTLEKGGYLTTSAKCLSDSGSDSSISTVTKGKMSLGKKTLAFILP